MRRAHIESLVMGGAVVAVITILVALFGSLGDLWPMPNPIIAPVGVGCGAACGWLATRPTVEAPFRLGAVVVGLGLLLLALIRSSPLGALEFIGLMAAVAVALIGGRTFITVFSRPVSPRLIACGLGALALVMMAIVVGGGQLGHDEAAYALKARAWLEGTPDTGWDLHRGVGLSVAALPVLLVSDSPEALRGLSVVFSLGTLVALWALGREVRSSGAGVAAAAIFGVAPSFLRRGSEFLSDVPSSGLLFVTSLFLWRWVTADSPRDRDLMWAATSAVLAIYVRYQSVLSLALLAGTFLLIGWGRIRRRISSVLGAAFWGLLLLVPHFAFASAATGHPLGVIMFTAGRGGREYVGQGLEDYAREFGDLLAGQIGAVAIVLGVLWIASSLARGSHRRLALFLAVPSVGQLVALGLISHGEPRFVFFPVGLLILAGVLAWDDLKARASLPAEKAIVSGLVVALFASLGVHGARFDRNAEAMGDSFQALVEAARLIVDATDGRCGVVTGLRPQLTWLSACETALFDLDQPIVQIRGDVDRFLIFTEGGLREPQGELKQAYRALAIGSPVRIEGSGSIGDVKVVPLQDWPSPEDD